MPYNHTQQGQPHTKPLPPHLRPSLAFPSSAVLAQSQYLLQQQQLGKTVTTLRDTTNSTTTTDSSNTTKPTVNAINAETLTKSSIPLPSRFTNAEHYAAAHTAAPEHPMYRTSNHQYGHRPPSQAELPKSYFPNQHKFTSQFAAGFNVSHTATQMQH